MLPARAGGILVVGLPSRRKGLDGSDCTCYPDCMGTMILRRIPDELRKQFKLQCIERGTNMTEQIILFMRKEVAKGKLAK